MADGNDEFKRRVAAQQQQVRARVADRAAARRPAVGDGLTADVRRVQPQPRTPTSAPGTAGLQTGTATQAEFDAARAKLGDELLTQRPAAQAAQRRAAGSRGPRLQVPQAGAAQASTLSPAEVDSFNRQSQGRFGEAFPQSRGTVGPRTPATAPLPPSIPAGQVRFDTPRATLGEGIANAQPRAAAVASRAAAFGETAGQRVGQVLRNPGVQRAGRVAGRAAAPVGLALEGMDVARVAADDQASGLDVAEQAARSTGKVAGGAAGAIAGAKLGAGLGTLVTPGIGTAIGGVGGAVVGGLVGAEGVDRVIDFFAGDDDPVAATNARDAAAAAGTQAGKPDFSNVVGGSGSVQGLAPPGAAQRQAANDGITPVADRVGNPDEVLGVFNGRPITRAESDQLNAGGASFGGGNAVRLGDSVAGPVRGGSVSAGNVGGGAEDRLRDIGDSSTPAGKLYAQLAQDKTPTGKRVAAQFLETYLGTGTQERGQTAGLRADEMGANASLLRGREGDASAERQVATGSRRPQYVFNEDGSIGQLADGVLEPVTTPTGAPAKADPRPRNGGTSALGALKEREELIGLRIGKPEDYASGEEYQAARQQALAELMAELGVGLDGA